MTFRQSVLEDLDVERLDWSDTEGVKSLVLLLIRELQETRVELQETWVELERVRRRLAFYENPHTPPSRRRPKEKKPLSSGRKRGAPAGHRGESRPLPSRVEVVVVPAGRCERCGSSDLEHVRVKEKTIEDLPEVPAPVATTFRREQVKCQACGHVFTAVHPKCPRVGRLGVNLLVFLVMLRFLPRSVLRKAGEVLEHVYHVRISAATTNAVLGRVAAAAEGDYRQILNRIRRSPVVYADETGFSVLGKPWWLWIFRSATDVALVLRDTRGGDVPREVLGVDYDRVVVRDGWTGYHTLQRAQVQRCWAHLLREAKEHADTLAGQHLYQRLCQMFSDLKTFNAGNPDQNRRHRQFTQCTRRLRSLLNHYARYPHLRKVITYARNGGTDWFTCILTPGVEPTNNLAEQPLREHVIMRQILGNLQSTHGAHTYETLASLITTWRLRGDNIPHQLKELITHHICLTKS